MTFGEGLRGISLHAEVVDQHDGKMLLHISRHQVPCMSRTTPEQDKLGDHNHATSHPRLTQRGGRGEGGRGVCEGGPGSAGGPRHDLGGRGVLMCRRRKRGPGIKKGQFHTMFRSYSHNQTLPPTALEVAPSRSCSQNCALRDSFPQTHTFTNHTLRLIAPCRLLLLQGSIVAMQ